MESSTKFMLMKMEVVKRRRNNSDKQPYFCN